ncbi:phytanoyl-CoA dioxygenase family protein [Flavisphingomonas formosensis]|uniref:phytanoyl-CoA dioxygenase family protein n=1 Tax=Flavisphingomonas formosensis TaxID=861534 RepID=UPI001E53F1E9|nr:phytanoyl-CoA dioxygenase family protein [Sphingomonas formosensis]
MLDTPTEAEISTSDFEEGVQNIRQFGYTVHRNFLSSDLREALWDRLDEQARMERHHGLAELSEEGHAGNDAFIGAADEARPPAYQKVSFLPNKGRVFRDLMLHPVALTYCERMFEGQPFVLSSQTGMILRTGGARQVLHVDQQPVPFRTPFPILINVMSCLSDYEPDMGSTRIIPGSHNLSSPDFTKPYDTLVDSSGGELHAVRAEAGSAVIWESRTWHSQWFSQSQAQRRSIATVYCVHFYRPQDNYPALVHDEVYPKLTDDEKRMMGFDAYGSAYGRFEPRSRYDPRGNVNFHRRFTPEMHRGA